MASVGSRAVTRWFEARLLTGPRLLCEAMEQEHPSGLTTHWFAWQRLGPRKAPMAWATLVPLATCRLCHRLQLRAGALWTADRCPAEWREPVDFQRGLCGVMILCHEANASLQPAWRPGSMLWCTAMPAPCSEWHRPSPVSTSAEVRSGSPADRLAWRRCSRCRIPLPLS